VALTEWPDEEAESTKYWFAILPEDIAFDQLVDLAKLCWRIERDYQELKRELGLGDYEERGWRGFHHHARLCIDPEAPPIRPERRIANSTANRCF
jgi:SRSO17 transposase